MKKITIVSIASLIFLLIASSVALVLKDALKSAVAALVIGILLLLISGVIAIAVRQKRGINIFCFILSSVAMGILIRAWYINREFNNSFVTMLLVSLGAVLYLWVFFALSRIPLVRQSRLAYILLCVLYAALSVAGYIIAVLKTETTYVSTLGYYMLIEFAFIFAMSLEVHNTDELIRNLTLSTYSVFVVAVIAGVFIVCALIGDGDCDCDCLADGCCDCIDLAGESSKKKKGK